MITTARLFLAVAFWASIVAVAIALPAPAQAIDCSNHGFGHGKVYKHACARGDGGYSAPEEDEEAGDDKGCDDTGGSDTGGDSGDSGGET